MISRTAETKSGRSESAPAIAGMQANLARAVKYPDVNARNWSLYFFFRILRKSETKPLPQLLAQQAELSKPQSADKSKKSANNSSSANGEEDTLIGQVIDALASGLTSGGALAARQEDDDELRQNARSLKDIPESLLPAGEFYAWLKRLANSEIKAQDTDGEADTAVSEGLERNLGAKLDPRHIHAQLEAMLANSEVSFDPNRLGAELFGLLARPEGAPAAVSRVLELILGHLSQPEHLALVMRTIGEIGGALHANGRMAAKFLFILSSYFRVLVSSPDLIATILSKYGGDPRLAGLAAVNGGLTMVSIHEILRQSAPAVTGGGQTDSEAMLRDETAQAKGGLTAKNANAPIDPMPVNIAFTYPGLEALFLDPETLDSFPDAFKEGMAARAERLGDTGASAPENWHGALGLRHVHGHFVSRFLVGDTDMPWQEEPWRRLREDVRLFNNRAGPRGKLLRALLGALFRPLGIEILHLELGQDPYSVDRETGNIVPDKFRREHFGFRDGISQPFIDMNLGTPPAGGGTPRRNRTWDNVARGEIFLGWPDEDGHVQLQPANKRLRDNGTYQVFRKLEQDVIGFRNFLKSQRSDSQDQEKLAAQFMGRWKDGTPLMVSTDTEINLGADRDGKTNDFLYSKDDPAGKKCPLGSHIRRSNPRDIGGNGDAKRHRILRRGIAYGGPLLPEGSNGDGEERGLLFVAVNSRIDLQFEMIQSTWINNGEYLGQAGLGRCPVTGANNGRVEDRFLEAGAVAPVSRIPQFVTTRGGDYFFVPSVDALRAIADNEKFPPDLGWQGGGWLDDVVTPSLFQQSRIRHYVMRILEGGERKIVVRPPSAPTEGSQPSPHEVHETPLAGAPITFVGRHKDVKAVLADNTGKHSFSVAHYREACRRTSRGYDLLIGTELKTDTGATRVRLQEVLKLAWGEFTANADFYSRLKSITDESIAAAVARTSHRGQIDLVGDLATDTVYRIVSELFGVPGPGWLTEMAIALPFVRKQVGDLERDWLTTLKVDKPENPGQQTLQLWSVIFLADLVGNHMRLTELNELARKSGAEFLNHLETLLNAARTCRPRQPDTLLETFVNVENAAIAHVRGLKGPGGNPEYTSEDYYIDVLMLLLELVGTPMSVVPTAWGNAIGTILNLRIDLPTLFAILGDPEPPMVIADGKAKPGAYSWITQLLYEVDRLNPSFKVFMRRSEKDNKIDKDLTIDKGHWVGAMAVCANLDHDVFPEPKEFSLFPFLHGPKRRSSDYLMFGAAGGGRDCWGRDRLALYLLDQFVRAASKLDGLQKVAGPRGDPLKLFEVTVGLPARFSKLRIKPVA